MASSISKLPDPARSPKTGELVARRVRALIVGGQLKDGDHLPTGPELMDQLDVGRSVMREALRILEDERLIEVRRGSRLGPQVRIPGPEIVARPAGLLLQLSGATLADVQRARCGFEPPAVRVLAATGGQDDFGELDALVAQDFPAAWQTNDLGTSAARFHLRLVELTGNAVLAMVAGVIHDITRANTPPPSAAQRLPRVRFDSLADSCRRLIELLRAGDRDAAETHWRLHLESPNTCWPERLDTIVIRGVLD